MFIPVLDSLRKSAYTVRNEKNNNQSKSDNNLNKQMQIETNCE